MEPRSGQLKSVETPPWRLPFWGVIFFTLLVSIPLRLKGATPDVSWLITMCERILDGEEAYVEIFETTPPVPMLLYMTGVLVARVMGLTPEATTFAFAYAAALGSIGLSARILPDVMGEGTSRWLVLVPAALVLFVLSNDAFAQREYFAAAFALPMFSVFVRHAQENEWPPMADRVLAMILAGLSVAIKPPLFAFPGLAVGLFYWWRTRDLSFLVSSGLLVAGVFGFAVTVGSLAAFPEYLGEITTLMREVYVPVRNHSWAFLTDRACLGVLSCLVVCLILCGWKKPPVSAVLALVVSISFLVAYFIQGKFFSYHVFPAAVFGGIAASILIYGRLLSNLASPFARLAAAAAVYALAVTSVLLFVGFDDRRPMMSDLSWAADLDRPRTLAISPELSSAFPLARRIGAIWVDRIHSQWVARVTRHALITGRLSESEVIKFLRYHDQDLQRVLCRIENVKPDIIIQDVSPEHSWLSSELLALRPNFLDGYKVIAEEGGLRILGRR